MISIQCCYLVSLICPNTLKVKQCYINFNHYYLSFLFAFHVIIFSDFKYHFKKSSFHLILNSQALHSTTICQFFHSIHVARDTGNNFFVPQISGSSVTFPVPGNETKTFLFVSCDIGN